MKSVIAWSYEPPEICACEFIAWHYTHLEQTFTCPAYKNALRRRFCLGGQMKANTQFVFQRTLTAVLSELDQRRQDMTER